MDEILPMLIAGALGPTASDPRRTHLVAVRLATSCGEDSAAAIATAVTDLVQSFHHRNDCGPQSVRLVIFSSTHDLTSAKPAAAARHAGWQHVPMLCLAEMQTVDDLPWCIRALLLVERGFGADPIRSLYLNGTQSLRPDLAPD